mmetsp:Transcript_98125/g.246006  ORF Transcript_98125/g.246006 Transcript_98125/m.246006 type:complete len:355 (+) Transcript_98125:804-1868(+)
MTVLLPRLCSCPASMLASPVSDIADTVSGATCGDVANTGSACAPPRLSARLRNAGITASRIAVIGLSFGWLKASTAMHNTDPNMRVAYESITTETCITSQSDCSAGTNEEAFCRALGKERVAKATTPKDTGEAQIAAMSAVDVFFFEAVCVSVYSEFRKKMVTAVTPQARNISDSYMLLRGKWPLSYQRPERRTAMETQEKVKVQKDHGRPSSFALAPPTVPLHQESTVLTSSPPKAQRSNTPWKAPDSKIPSAPCANGDDASTAATAGRAAAPRAEIAAAAEAACSIVAPDRAAPRAAREPVGAGKKAVFEARARPPRSNAAGRSLARRRCCWRVAWESMMLFGWSIFEQALT